MPNPTVNDAHVDRVLTNMAMNYVQDQDKFLADQVFPYVGVNKQSGKYFTFDKGDMLRNEAREWVSGTESAGSGYRLTSSSTYTTTTYAFHKDVGDDVKANSDDPLQPYENATDFVMQKLLIQKERHFGSNYMTSGDWDNSDDPSDWSPGSGNTPLDDLITQAQNVQSNWAWPTVGVCGDKTMKALVRHSDFTDMYKHTTPGILGKDLIADVLDLDRIFVGKAVYDTSNEEATTSTDFCIPSDAFLLLYVPDNPQIDIPSAGYTFGWEDLAGADGRNITISQFRIKHLSVDRVEGKMAYDMKQTGSGLGAISYDVLS